MFGYSVCNASVRQRFIPLQRACSLLFLSFFRLQNSCLCADANAAIFLKSVTDDSDVLMHRSGVTTVADNSFPTAHTKLYEIGNGCHFPCRAIFRRKFNAVNGYVFTILRNKRKRVIKALFDIAKYNIFASVNKNSGKLSAYIKKRGRFIFPGFIIRATHRFCLVPR